MVNLSCLLVAVVPFITEHRNMYPSNMVSTNFYGSVTGIVDSAYIAERAVFTNELDPVFLKWKDSTRLMAGKDAYVASVGGTAIGVDCLAIGEGYSVAMGYGATASGEHSSALGAGGTIASGGCSISVGNSSRAKGYSSTAVGYTSYADGDMSAAFGGNTYARGKRSLATGWAAVADAENATAVGNGAWVKTNALGAVAIGSGAYVGLGATNAVQIGYGVNTNAGTIQYMDKPLMYRDDPSVVTVEELKFPILHQDESPEREVAASITPDEYSFFIRDMSNSPTTTFRMSRPPEFDVSKFYDNPAIDIDGWLWVYDESLNHFGWWWYKNGEYRAYNEVLFNTNSFVQSNYREMPVGEIKFYYTVEAVEKKTYLAVDNVVTDNSTNLITSGAVANKFNGDFAAGKNATAGRNGIAVGCNLSANDNYSMVVGANTASIGTYTSHGVGTFSIAAWKEGENGYEYSPESVYIGNSNLVDWIYAYTAQPTKRYALFVINLNPCADPCPAPYPYADIELKGTTNNFYNEEIEFYCATSINGDPDRTDNPPWEHDWCRLYILSSEVDTDVRRWKRIRNTVDIFDYRPREIALLVDPSSSYLRRDQGNQWLYENNEELIWSYVRLTPYGPEMDDDGVHQLWRPIMPVKWYAELPEWANQESY